MKLLYWSLAVLIVIGSCASSSKNEEQQESFENLVSLQKPGEQPSQPSKIYIDSVQQINSDQKPVLLIKGTFPDACTHLQEVTHHIKSDSLYLKMKAWRNPEKMCAQVLTSFSFMYDKFNDDELSSRSEVIINEVSYSY